MFFIKKKNTSETQPNTKIIEKINKQKRNISILNFSIFGVIVGAVVGLTIADNVYNFKNGFFSYQYSNAINVKVEIDTTKTSSDPFASNQGIDTEKDLKTFTTNFSNWLEYNKIETYNTVKLLKHNDHYYLNMILPTTYTTWYNANSQKFDTDHDKVIKPMINTLFDSFYGSNISLIADRSTERTGGFSSANSSIISQEELASSKADIKVATAKNTICIDTPSTSSGNVITTDDWKNWIKNNWEKSTSSSATADEDQNAQIYIIRDQETLINRMHFILQAYATYKTNGDSAPDNIKNNYYYLSDSEKTWAENIFSNTSADVDSSKNFITPKLFATTQYSTSKVYDTFSSLSSDSNPFNSQRTSSNTPLSTYLDNDAYFYRLLDATYSSDVTADVSNKIHYSGIDNAIDLSGKIKTKSTVDWMKPYVVGIITKDNYKDFFPTKDPTDTSAQANDENLGKWFVTKLSSESEAYKFKQSLLGGKFFLPFTFKVITTELTKASGNNNYTFDKAIFIPSTESTTWDNFNDHTFFVTTDNNFFLPTIFGSNTALMCLLSIILILLLIGILISILYRVPGLIASIFTIGIASAITFLFVYFNHYISLCVVIGVMLSIFLFLISCLNLIRRIKKESVISSVFSIAVKKAIVKSIMNVIDFHIVAGVIGVCIFYLSSISVSDLGLCSLYGVLFSLGSYILFALCMFLLFNNEKTKNKANLCFSKKQLSKSLVLSKEEIEYEIKNKGIEQEDFVPSYSKKLSFFNILCKKSLFLIQSVIICSFVLLIVFGIVQIYEGIGIFHSVGRANNAKTLLLIFLVGCSGITFYSTVRFGWIGTLSFAIPSFLVGFILSLFLNLNISSKFFNETETIVLLAYFISQILIFNIIYGYYSKWIKKRIFLTKEFNNSLLLETKTSFLRYHLPILVLFSGIMIVFAILNSFSTLLPSLGIVLLVFILFFISVILCFSLCSFFLYIRIRFLIRLQNDNIFYTRKYDKTDEQKITGINHFKKINEN